VIRGGNFNNNASNLRSANRNNNNPWNDNNNIGARCAKTVGHPGRQDVESRRDHGPAGSDDPQSTRIPPRRQPGARTVPAAQALLAPPEAEPDSGRPGGSL